MSHELRTPLNAIAGYAELIELGIGGPVSEQQREPARASARSQQHLLGIINDLLNYSADRGGRGRYDLSRCPLHERLERVLAHGRAAGRAQKRSALSARPCAPELVAMADRAQGRADRAQPAVERREVHARGRRDDVVVRIDAASAQIAVSDTGPGIPRRQARHDLRAVRAVGRKLTSTHEGTGSASRSAATSRAPWAATHGRRAQRRGRDVHARLSRPPDRPTIMPRSWKTKLIHSDATFRRVSLARHAGLPRLDDRLPDRGRERATTGGSTRSATPTGCTARPRRSSWRRGSPSWRAATAPSSRRAGSPRSR